MRIRSIKPEFWRSTDVTVLSREQRLLFIGIWSYVDDSGVGRDDLAAIVGDLFSADMLADPAGTIDFVRKGLAALAERRLIVRYVVDHHSYLKIVKWDVHQYISHPNKARYPEPDDALLEGVRKSSGSSPESLRPGTGEQGISGSVDQGIKNPLKEKAAKNGRRLPEDWYPSPAMVNYAVENAPSVEDIPAMVAYFKDYWLAKTGRDGTKLDWDATWRMWCRRQHHFNVQDGWKPAPPPGEEYLYQ